MEGFIHGHIIALPGQIPRAGKPCRAGPHHGYLVPVLFRHEGSAFGVGVVVIGHEPFQPPDAHGLALDTPYAVFLTLALLGTDPAAHSGQSAVRGDDLIGALEITLPDLGDELRDMDVHGATLDAGKVPAVETPLCFVQCLLLAVPQRHFVEVVSPHLRGLAGHRILFLPHVGHFTSPPWRTGYRPLHGP